MILLDNFKVFALKVKRGTLALLDLAIANPPPKGLIGKK